MIGSVCSHEIAETPRGGDFKVTADAISPSSCGWVLGHAGLCGMLGPSPPASFSRCQLHMAHQAPSTDLVQSVSSGFRVQFPTGCHGSGWSGHCTWRKCLYVIVWGAFLPTFYSEKKSKPTWKLTMKWTPVPIYFLDFITIVLLYLLSHSYPTCLSISLFFFNILICLFGCTTRS